jgi:hypothetical protein
MTMGARTAARMRKRPRFRRSHAWVSSSYFLAALSPAFLDVPVCNMPTSMPPTRAPCGRNGQTCRMHAARHARCASAVLPVLAGHDFQPAAFTVTVLTAALRRVVGLYVDLGVRTDRPRLGCGSTSLPRGIPGRDGRRRRDHLGLAVWRRWWSIPALASCEALASVVRPLPGLVEGQVKCACDDRVLCQR